MRDASSSSALRAILIAWIWDCYTPLLLHEPAAQRLLGLHVVRRARQESPAESRRAAYPYMYVRARTNACTREGVQQYDRMLIRSELSTGEFWM